MQEKISKMQVKVFFGEKTKIINTARTTTYEELLQQIMKEFEIATKMQNCRIRSYNVPSQTMQETYTGHEKSPLEDLRIYPQKSLALEVKKDEEIFEEFDPTNMQIKINVWRPKILVLDEAALKPLKLVVKKTAKISSFIETISGATSIPKEKLV